MVVEPKLRRPSLRSRMSNTDRVMQGIRSHRGIGRGITKIVVNVEVNRVGSYHNW